MDLVYKCKQKLILYWYSLVSSIGAMKHETFFMVLICACEFQGAFSLPTDLFTLRTGNFLNKNGPGHN